MQSHFHLTQNGEKVNKIATVIGAFTEITKYVHFFPISFSTNINMTSCVKHPRDTQQAN